MSTKKLCPDISQKQFDMAVKLTCLATELDEAKNNFDPYVRHLSIGGVRKLHTLAEALAGDRSNEIYAPDDENLLSGHPDEVVA